MLALGLIFLGLVSWRELPVQRLPDITFPSVYYSAWIENSQLSPEQTNDVLTRPFEKMVASLPGLKGGKISFMGSPRPAMRSVTYDGRFWGYAVFEQGVDMRFRVIELQDKIAKWVSERPEKIQFAVFPASTDEGAGRLMELVLSVPVGQESRIATITDLIRRRLRSIDGISQVDIAGEMLPSIALETEQDYLRACGLDVGGMVDSVNKASREKTWLGPVYEEGARREVLLRSRIESLDDLLRVRLGQNGVFLLGDVVEPARKVKESESIYRYNGKKAVRVSVSRERDRNMLVMARRVRDRVAEIEKELPEGFSLSSTWDEAADLEKMIAEIGKLAMAGAVLAMLVLLLFTRSWRISLVIGTAIPTSVIVSFNAMYATGMSVNLLSLLGLGVGIGMLVDNSIVVVENIFRHFQKSHDVRASAWKGTSEVGVAILVSTLTNLAVFLPLLFVDKMTILIAKEMVLALVFSMTVSLVVAITLIPMLTARVIETTGTGAGSGRLSRLADRLSSAVFRHPWKRPGRRPRNLLREFVFHCARGSIRHPVRLVFTILGILVATLFVSGIKLALSRYGSDQDTREISLYGKPPVGSKLEEADPFFLEKEKQVAGEIVKSDVFESFTSNFTKTGGEITLKVSPKYRRLNEREFADAYRKLISGDQNSGFRFYPFPEVSFAPQMTRPGGWERGMAEAALVTGENSEAMLQAAKLVEDYLRAEPDVGEVVIETPQGEPEVRFEPDIERILVMKANIASINSFLNARSDRGIETALTLDEKDVRRRVIVRVKTEEEKRNEEVKQTLNELKRAMIALDGGGVIPLEELGRFSITRATPSISKENRQRNMRVGFNFKPLYSRFGMEKKRQDALKGIQKRLNGVRLPTGVSANLSGTLEDVAESQVTWKKTLWLAALTVYLVMAFFFESLVSPLVILITLPLASIGGIWGIVLFNARLDQVAMIGSVLLTGLAVNNGILLIEYTRRLERSGFRRVRALMYAVSYRLRPILMTSLTTILGLLPIALSKDAQNEAQSLVSVIVGGMIVSGLLSLVAVPTFYNVFHLGMDKAKARVRRAAWIRRIAWIRRLIPRRTLLAAPEPAWAAAGAIPSAAASRRRVSGIEAVLPELPASVFRRSTSAAGVLPSISKEAFGDRLWISIRNVSKIYPRFRVKKLLNAVPSRRYPYGRRPPSGTEALRHVSLEIGPGMFGLLGPNGAGKTTLMKILTGIVEPTYGAVEEAGHDLRFFRHEIRRFISYLPQNFGVYQSLNLDQYLNFFAPAYGLHDLAERKKRIGEVVEMVGLSAARRKPMRRFSGGMRQRAGIAQFLLRPNPIIIVDEPTAGLDPAERVRFRLLLSELARSRIVILSTHIVDDITSSCKQVAVLNQGRLLYHGDLKGIERQAQGRVWDVVLPAAAPAPVPPRQILFRKHVAEGVLYHYISGAPAPGSAPVQPTFEDAYIALLSSENTTEAE